MSGRRRSQKPASRQIWPTPMLHGPRVTLRPPAAADAGSGFIGSASLHSFSADGTTAAYAVGLLTPDVLGHGLGTETTRLVLAHAFDDLGLRELTVRVLELNSRAIGCYAGCGFSSLRREPDAVTPDGISHADVIMHLEAEQYRRLVATWDAGPSRSDV